MLMFLYLFYLVIMVLMMVISIAYVTLLERKILGLIQFRYGPNKVGLDGIFQPFSDGFKLMSKSSFNLIMSFGLKYLFMPISMFILMLFIWFLFPFFSVINSFDNSGLMVLSLLSIMIYPLIIGGWFSFSIYSMLGSVRCISQMISYEVSLFMIVFTYFLLGDSFSLIGFSNLYLFFMLPLFILFMFSILMELNRSPSDLIESESELVSGFNTEYYGLNFSLIFLGEYGMIMFFSGLFVLMVIGNLYYWFLGGLFTLLIIIFIIFIRGSFPRIRYDFLMYLCWTSVISISLGYLIFICGVFLILW